MSAAVRDIGELAPLGGGLDHPEGVAWGPDGFVYAGGEGGQLYRIGLEDGTCEEFASTGGNVLGLALDADADVYACDLERREVVRVTSDGHRSVYSAGLPERPMTLPNYPVFADDGTLYVSDSGNWAERDGLIWRVHPDGQTEVWDEQACGFTNGMCLSADGRSLLVAESSPPLVSRIPIAADGSAGERAVVVELPRTVPDGLALDRDGGLLISLYNPNVVYHLDTDGDLRVLYDDWEQLVLLAPTNVAFAGDDLSTLVIANLFGRELRRAPAAVSGLPLRYPSLS